MIMTTHRLICPDCSSARVLLDADEQGKNYTIVCADCDSVIKERVAIHEVLKDD